MSKPMPPTTCAHCSTKVDVPPHQNLYWRCGVCRRINGRPAYARGCVSACLRCGWCYFYGSRLTHAAATVLLATIVLGGLCWALPTARLRRHDHAARAHGNTHRYRATTRSCRAARPGPRRWRCPRRGVESFALEPRRPRGTLLRSACAVGSFFAAARSAPGGVPRKSREAWARELRALLPEDERAGLSAARLPWCDVCAARGVPPRARENVKRSKTQATTSSRRGRTTAARARRASSAWTTTAASSTTASARRTTARSCGSWSRRAAGAR